MKGPEGNIEYLIWLTPDSSREDQVTDARIDEVVRAAHGELDR